MFAAVGRFVVRHPVWVIVAWVVAAVGVIGFAPTLTATTDEAAFLPSHYESIRAAQLQQQAFPQAATPAAIIVFERRDGAAADRHRRGEGHRDRAGADRRAHPRHHRHHADAALAEPADPDHRGADDPAARPGDQAQADAVKALRAALPAPTRGHRPQGRHHRYGRAGPRRTEVRGPGQRDHRDQHDRPHPHPAADHLPEPDHRAAAGGRDRSGVADRDRPDRLGQRGVRPEDRQFGERDADRRAVRRRHRLHPVPDVPLPGTAAARRGPEDGDGQRGRPGRRGDRVGGRCGHHRVPGADAVDAGPVQVPRARAGHRGRHHPGRRTHPHPGGGVAARHQGVLAVEGVAARAARRPVRRDRPLAGPPPGAVRRRCRAPCWSCWPSSPSASTPTST